MEQYWSQHAGRGREGLGYEQFKVIMGRERPTSRDDLMGAFARLDRNGDGYITADELMRVVTKVGGVLTKVGVVWFVVRVWAASEANWNAVQSAVVLCSVCSVCSASLVLL